MILHQITRLQGSETPGNTPRGDWPRQRSRHNVPALVPAIGRWGHSWCNRWTPQRDLNR